MKPSRIARHAVVGAVGLGIAASSFAASAPIPSLWHPLRPAVSTFGADIDWLYWMCFYLTGAILIVVQAVLILFTIRYRAVEGGKALFLHGNHRLEVIWTIIPAVILVLIAAVSKSTWDTIRVDIPSGENVARIECIAQQFAWFFRHPGNDGEFGPRDWHRLEVDRARNVTSDPWELDREAIPKGWTGANPPGRDDYTIEGELRIPADRPVRILLTSNDTLHSFFIPEFRVKHDAVPGMNGGRVWFQIEWEKARSREFFDIACAELCGLSHYSMKGKLIVLPTGPIDPWVSAKSGADLRDLRDADDAEFLAKVLSRQATYETYQCAMSKIAEAENAGGEDY